MDGLLMVTKDKRVYEYLFICLEIQNELVVYTREIFG